MSMHYSMTEEEQAAIYLKLRREYGNIAAETNSLYEAIKQQSDRLSELVEALRAHPETLQLDKPTLVKDIESLCLRLARYRELTTDKADRESRLKSLESQLPPIGL